jgi:hypothetical protein
MDATVRAIANFNPIIPFKKTKTSGLIRGEETRNAIIGPQGKAVTTIEIITAIVPQAHKRVKVANPTLPHKEKPDLLIKKFLTLS